MPVIAAQEKGEIENQGFLRRLPLLDFTADLYLDIDLSDVYIICAQHLVSTTYSLFRTLLKLGLKASNLSAIGKCYSTDPLAYAEMQKLGIDACPSSLLFNSHQSFDEQYRENIKQFVNKRAKKLTDGKFRKLIILDDGGELIPAVNALLQEAPRVVGIEQTSSGFHRLKTKKIKFPIINVARSPAKLNYESPIIARLVVDTLVSHISDLSLRPEKVLIIGNGPIGSRIREVLQDAYHLSTFDKTVSRSSIKSEDFEQSLKKFDLIIGCTGKLILGPEHYRLLKKDVILVSASSSDREFDAVNLRSRVPLVANCHENLFIDDLCLINCGFPINFSSEFRAIDSDELQLTRSLLLAAILQANHCPDFSKAGFIALDVENQREIVQKHLSIFAGDKLIEGESLAI
jgi:S-adenosylhomocysteine hydrolase